MTSIERAAIAAACCGLAACGGSDDGPQATGVQPIAATYGFTTPTAGSIDRFSTSTVDDANNTIPGEYQETVASVGTDGSYVLAQSDPSGTSLTVNGIAYRFDPAVLRFDGQGHELSATVDHPGVVEQCTFATTGGGHALPWSVGQTWNATAVENCGSFGSVTSTITGQVASYESVTVPAGTFMALRLQSTERYTTATGQQVVETITHWADPAHSLFTLKTVVTYQRSGTVPAHYVVTRTIELQGRTTATGG